MMITVVQTVVVRDLNSPITTLSKNVIVMKPWQFKTGWKVMIIEKSED